MIRNYPQSRGFDFYRNGGVRIDPMREDQMRALERRMASFFQYHYQNGGQGPQLMYRPGMTSGDLRTNFGLSDRRVSDQYEMEAIAREQAAQAAAEERQRQLAEAAWEKARAEQRRKLSMVDTRTTGDMAANFNIPSTAEAKKKSNVEIKSDVEANQREVLQNNLERLGYDKRVAGIHAKRGWDQLTSSMQQRLEEQAEGDRRVRYHPDYDASLPIEQQQALQYDDSFRAGMFRQYNKLNDSGNPVMNLVTGALTAPAKAVMNLTMDADKQYYEPGLVQGIGNLGNDILSLLPNAPEAAANALVSRASPRALGYMANPAVQGADDLGKAYFKTVANSKNAEKLVPHHAFFAQNVQELLDRGVPLKNAIESSYWKLPGDDITGMNLNAGQSPIEVYQQIKQAQSNLPAGKRWANSSYSIDSYPLVMDYVNRKLDKEAYKIIPSYQHSPLNKAGFKSQDVLAALPENMKDTYKAGLKKLEELKIKKRDFGKGSLGLEDPKLGEELRLKYAQLNHMDEAVQNNLSNQVNRLMQTNEDFRLKLLNKINSRIGSLNKEYNINMPLAVADNSNISVPQFAIQKRDPNILRRFLNFPRRVGLDEIPAFRVNRSKPAFRVNRSKPAFRVNRSEPAFRVNRSEPSMQEIEAAELQSIQDALRNVSPELREQMERIYTDELYGRHYYRWGGSIMTMPFMR